MTTGATVNYHGTLIYRGDVFREEEQYQREIEKSTVSPKTAKFRHQVTYIELVGSF